MKFRSFFLAAIAVISTAILAAQAQLPGVNSTLQTVFTYAYEVSTMKPTYSTSTQVVAPSASTDLCSIVGSATKQIRLRRVIVSGAIGTAAAEPIALIKRSTVNTGGAGSQQSGVPYDASSVAATATTEVFTTVATLGTVVGTLADILHFWGATTTRGVAFEYQFGRFGQPVILRSAAQNVAVNMGAYPAYNSITFTCTWEWTEE